MVWDNLPWSFRGLALSMLVAGLGSVPVRPRITISAAGEISFSDGRLDTLPVIPPFASVLLLGAHLDSVGTASA